MQKKQILLILLLTPFFLVAQDYSELWKGYFSYYNIKDVIKGKNKIYAASENAVFSLDIKTNAIEEITTVNGLSGEAISTMYYSEAYELLIIGYETGLIEIVFDNDDDVFTVRDIVNKPTILFDNKRINHFEPYQDVVYISTNYGISVFNLKRLEFGDTYFIGNAGSQTQVKQTAVYNGFIYAACYDNGGVKKASLSSSNLIDYKSWQTISGGYHIAIENNQDKLYAISNDNRIYSIINDVFTELYLFSEKPLRMTSKDNYLIITTTTNIYVYDINFNLTAQVSFNQEFNTAFSSAITDSQYIYIGTEYFGVLKTSITNPTAFQEVHPQGPLLNTPFSLQAHNGGVWVTFGDYDSFYNPYYPLPKERGISYLAGNTWKNTPYKDVLGAKCLNGISINPFNNNQVFVSSFFSGLLELRNGIPSVLYDESNSELESLVDPKDSNYKDIRIGNSAFDSQGLLWTITSKVNRPLKSYNPITKKWNSYDFTPIIPNGFTGNLGFKELVVDSSTNTKFITSHTKGVIGFNENSENIKLRFLSEENNLPIEHVRALAVDRNNQLWIGTHLGLRVLYNTSNFFTASNLRAEEIIILEDGVAKELMAGQFISDIKVDGANNKWIGTVGSGVFYLSPDGQKTIYHFTTENSPLPSNDISDISIDDSNGMVYIATNKGLVSFRSNSSKPLEDLQSVYVYPNPVRPHYDMVHKKVKITGFSENVNIKITDIEGNLVAEAQSRVNQRREAQSEYNLEINGGTATWNGKNLVNNIVASGVYLVMITDLDTTDTSVLKLMVVR